MKHRTYKYQCGTCKLEWLASLYESHCHGCHKPRNAIRISMHEVKEITNRYIQALYDKQQAKANTNNYSNLYVRYHKTKQRWVEHQPQ